MKNVFYKTHRWSAFFQYLKAIPLYPAYWFLRGLLFESGAFIQHRGVIIADFGPKKEHDSLFVEKTKAALDFLAETDPRRFQRVQRFIKAIIYSNRGLARYNHKMTCCLVGFAYFHFEDDAPHKIPWYARTLVHEATHGVFCEHRIPYTKRTRERIEYACVLEEWRFTQRFQDGLDWYDHTWSRTISQAWDNVWNESMIHRFQTIFRPNANGELESQKPIIPRKRESF